jgi:N-acetylglucosamine-6-sulfatase
MMRDRRAPSFISLSFLARLIILVIFGGHGCGGSGKDEVARPNIVVIMTDDQRWDELAFMPVVTEQLVSKGVNFTNSFVTTALCCPSRAGFLTGQYSHNHGVITLGGAPKFDASSTLAVWLHGAGYRTALIGKYMNNNGNLAPVVPAGWDTWRTFADYQLVSFTGAALYYDYRLNEDGKLVSYGSEEADYSTDVLGAMAVEFILANADRPFFLVFTPFGPHAPPLPAPRHAGRFGEIDLSIPESFLEADVSDKPRHVRVSSDSDQWSEERQASLPEKIRRVRIPTLESLLAVDEAVEGILEALREQRVDDRTVVLFTSDNGFLWGEHWKLGKLVPYEESIRVPLVIRDPRLGNEPREEPRMVLNIDLAPTIAELAGATAPDTVDGRSLVGLMRSAVTAWREDFLIELLPHRKQASFAGVRTPEWKYVEIADEEPSEELYDLRRDPHEMDNLLHTRRKDPNVIVTAERLRARLVELKRE